METRQVPGSKSHFKVFDFEISTIKTESQLISKPLIYKIKIMSGHLLSNHFNIINKIKSKKKKRNNNFPSSMYAMRVFDCPNGRAVDRQTQIAVAAKVTMNEI